MDIADWRKKIDELDRQMVELLNQRASAEQEIGRLKRNTKLPIYEPDRGKQVFENVRALNGGPLPGHELQHICERLIDGMCALQKEEIQPKAETPKGEREFEAEL